MLTAPAPSSAPRRIHRLAPALAILAALLGVALYFYSTSLYFAATSLDPARSSYHHLQRYWCELFNAVTYTGQPNPGRPVAMAATFALVTSLFFFWFSVPALFADLPLLAQIVRFAGALAAVAASLIFTHLHDLVITFAAPLGFAAVLATCIGLARRRERPLLLLALLAVIVGMSDYFAWKMEIWKNYQPLIQKSAFALVFLWVLSVALKKVLKLPATQPR